MKIEKIILSAGATGDKLVKAMKLLKIVSGKQPAKCKARKRIPAFNIRPGLEIGCKVTIRKNTHELLNRLLEAVNRQLKKKQIQDNCFSFGIHEYIEIPGTEYQRDIGIMGFDITVVFTRQGRRVKIKKIKRGKIPIKQNVSKEEIINFMEKNFNVEIK